VVEEEESLVRGRIFGGRRRREFGGRRRREFDGRIFWW